MVSIIHRARFTTAAVLALMTKEQADVARHLSRIEMPEDPHFSSDHDGVRSDHIGMARSIAKVDKSNDPVDKRLANLRKLKHQRFTPAKSQDRKDTKGHEINGVLMESGSEMREQS